MAQENLKKLTENNNLLEISYKLGLNEMNALDIIYETHKIQEGERFRFTQEIKQEIIDPIYQGIINSIKDRINNILCDPYTSIQIDELEGKILSPSSVETKEAIMKIKKILDIFSSNKDLTIDYHIEGSPTLTLADKLKKEGL